MTRVRAAAGSLSRQLALAVAIVVAPVLIALVVVGLLMVISDHAAVLVAAIVVAAGALAVLAAKLVADSILQDVGAISRWADGGRARRAGRADPDGGRRRAR